MAKIYCYFCGGKLRKFKNFFICRKCHKENFDNPRPCTMLFIENSKREMLFFYRRKNPGIGMLDVPGGFVEEKESFEESVRREAKEEIGVEIKNLKYLGSYPGKYYFQDEYFPVLGVAFEGQINHRKIKTSSEAQKIVFIPKKEIEIKKIYSKDVRLALKDYLRKK